MRFLTALAALAIASSAYGAPFGEVRFGAYVNPLALGVVTGGQAPDVDDCSRTVRQMATFKALTGDYPRFAHCWINNGAVDPKDPGLFPIDSVRKMHAMHITPILNVRCDTPARILSGADDAYYRAFALAAAPLGYRILFRGTGWEFNISDIHSCATQENAAGFVAAWKHVHDIFVAAGATNIKWVWAPAAPRVPQGVSAFWPGADYVDRVMFDHYPNTPAEEDFADPANPLTADLTYWCNMGKQCGVAETAARQENQPAFFASITAYLQGRLAAKPPANMDLIVYFDRPNEDTIGPKAGFQWQLSPAGAKAWAAMVNAAAWP